MSANLHLADVNLAYRLGGPRDAPLVLLLGGLTVPMSAWGQLESAMQAEGLQTLAFDYAGRGRSSPASSTPDLQQHIRHASELIDALALGPTLTAVGWSFGALVAAGLAVRRPGLVSQLVMVAPMGYGMALPTAAQLLQLPLVGDLLFAWKGRALLLSALEQHGVPEPLLPGYRAAFKEQLARTGVRPFLALLRHIDPGFSADLDQLAVLDAPPVKILWGAQDQVISPEHLPLFQQKMARAECALLAGMGHAPHLQDPRLLARHTAQAVGMECGGCA